MCSYNKYNLFDCINYLEDAETVHKETVQEEEFIEFLGTYTIGMKKCLGD